MKYEIDRDSQEYLFVQVIAKKSGDAYDPTSDTVSMSFPTFENRPTAWHSADWTTFDDKHFARVLIGRPDGVILSPNEYSIYVKITDSPETPVKLVGRLVIT